MGAESILLYLVKSPGKHFLSLGNIIKTALGDLGSAQIIISVGKEEQTLMGLQNGKYLCVADG